MERLWTFDRRSLAFGALALAALVAVVSSPRLLGDEIGDALAGLAVASPGLLWLAAACFLASLACMGCAWRAGVRSCGGEIDAVGATARYAAGSFANSIAPAGCGGALRIALFSRVLPHRERLWTAGGITAAVTAARAASVAGLVAVAAALGTFPVWPVLLLGGAGAVAGAVALVARRSPARSRIAHAFDVFRALGSVPARAATLFGWVGLAVLARLAAAACVASAVGVDDPLAAGVIALAALALAGLVQITPGNVGVASGAIALALHAHGVELPAAISTGIAFHALETSVSLLIGGAGMVYLAQLPLPVWSVRLAGGCACLALGGAFGATVLV